MVAHILIKLNTRKYFMFNNKNNIIVFIIISSGKASSHDSRHFEDDVHSQTMGVAAGSSNSIQPMKLYTRRYIVKCVINSSLHYCANNVCKYFGVSNKGIFLIESLAKY